MVDFASLSNIFCIFFRSHKGTGHFFRFSYDESPIQVQKGNAPPNAPEARFPILIRLQVQNAVADFLRASLIPVLRADIAASPTRYVHFALVGVPATRTAPNQFAVLLGDFNLAVPAADLTVIAFRVQFRVDDVVVDELHDG